MDIECGGFTFVSNFDSSNIDRVELVPQAENDNQSGDEKEIPILEFNIWTKADCAGTEFANSNRSWFYFGVKGGLPCTEVKLNVVNLNKQGKLYDQGMAPVYKITPGPNRWERVRDYLSFDLKNNLLSFGYRTVENLCSTTYFAFTYPYSYIDLQNSFKCYDAHLKKLNTNPNPLEANPDDIYYHRECLVKSLEGRSVDLITISSHHGITQNREPRLKGLFPDMGTPRSHTFKGKKVIFLSARVHPGETPSSFVMNGVLHLLLSRNDTTAILLRKLFIFKLIPMLNPDGVSRGFYRTDTRGANLNRFYLNPSEVYHPSVFAARSLILYYHNGYEKRIDPIGPHFPVPAATTDSSVASTSDAPQPPATAENADADQLDVVEGPPPPPVIEQDGDGEAVAAAAEIVGPEGDATSDDAAERSLHEKVAEISMAEEAVVAGDRQEHVADEGARGERCTMCGVPPVQLPKIAGAGGADSAACRMKLAKVRRVPRPAKADESKRSHESGLYLYVDFHGHASKRGIFMYGNHFDNVSDKVECLLLPKLLSLNNPHFHFNQCNFSRRNMYTRDRRDGLSKEGCGRVAVHKYTGLVKSYTLECNYNTGCIVNIIPPTQRPLGKHLVQPLLVPPKYTPQIYEEVGRALCVSILDITGANPNSRLPLSQYKSVQGVREALRCEVIVAKSSAPSQQSQTMKLRQGIALLQRGNKGVAGKNFAAAKRGGGGSKSAALRKRPSKSALFPDLAASQSLLLEKSTAIGGAAGMPPSSSGAVLHHPTLVAKCGSGAGGGSGLSSTAAGVKLKKQRLQAAGKKPAKKLATRMKGGGSPKRLKQKMFGPLRLEELWPGRPAGESSEQRSAGKRKIEKKSTGNAGTSVRPPNKKRKKSKIM